MPLRRSDLGDFAYFVSIAKQGSFRAAAIEMGVSASALSHAISGLEERLGLRLLNRTTRSVTLTTAGEALLQSIDGPLGDIEQAMEDLNRFRDRPAGRIRINVLEDAASQLLTPALPVFIERYPDVEIDISVNNRLIDIIASGFDAGIRHGGTVPEDMIAQRLSPDFRWRTAASPAYIRQSGTPSHPRELTSHRCVRFRLGNDQMYSWEFDADGEMISVDVPGPVTVRDSHTMLDLGLRGAGIIYGPEPVLSRYVANGQLEWVLESYAPIGPGYHMYYSSRKHLPTGLRLLIDLIRELKPCG